MSSVRSASMSNGGGGDLACHMCLSAHEPTGQDVLREDNWSDGSNSGGAFGSDSTCQVFSSDLKSRRLLCRKTSRFHILPTSTLTITLMKNSAQGAFRRELFGGLKRSTVKLNTFTGVEAKRTKS